MKKIIIIIFTVFLSAITIFASGAADYILKNICDNFGRISNIEVTTDVITFFNSGNKGKSERRKYVHYIQGNSSARIDNLAADEKTAFFKGRLYIWKHGKIETLPAPVFNKDMFYPEPALLFDLKNYFKGFESRVDKADKSIIMKPASIKKGEYPRIVLKIYSDNKMPEEMIFYDKDKKSNKKITFRNYKIYNGVFVPEKALIETYGKNPAKKEITFSNIKINGKMEEKLFSLK
jgi:hypothetical protein